MADSQTTLPPVAAMVHHCCSLLRERLRGGEALQGLVVGCGNGDEAIFMERSLRCRRVVGVDVQEKFSSLARASGRVFLGDAESLPFASDTFHFAAAFHSLEHVRNPRRTVEETWRVLKPGGWFYVGVPNRSRLVGYLGSFDMTAWQKISGNLKAWQARLQGRFRNELGAHAGFDRRELTALLGERFTGVEIVTAEYVRFKYAGRIPRLLLNALLAPEVSDHSASSHYALCQKPA